MWSTPSRTSPNPNTRKGTGAHSRDSEFRHECTQPPSAHLELSRDARASTHPRAVARASVRARETCASSRGPVRVRAAFFFGERGFSACFARCVALLLRDLFGSLELREASLELLLCPFFHIARATA
mmetsp:Transcript_32509/g.68409  ORF Transcript_32509/g.68409 Transcript_32509/m.68409 type:complete len:127 (-) Transcript_32509:844-1224(-)